MSPLRPAHARMLTAQGLFAGLLALVVARAIDLSVLRGPMFARLAAAQHRQHIALMSHRGPIVDRQGEALALSLDVPSVYMRPHVFGGQEARLPALAAALDIPLSVLRRKAGSDRPFVWLRRQVRPRQAEAVARLRLRGVYAVAEGRRFYPHNTLAAHVLGFVGVDSQGLEGIERRLDRAIRGAPQDVEADRDAHGREMFTGGVEALPGQGSRVELTLDAAIQELTERELAAGVAAARAAAGAALVLDPATGEVLALANVPTYNPNQPGSLRDPSWRDRIRNRAITDPYEPGSTLKAVLAAAAIEERAVAPAESIFCENGRLRLGKWTIHDAHPHRWLTFAQVIQYSSNIGASKVAERLGRERYFGYLRAFGLGARTGIELPGETPGIIRPLDTWARIDLATHSFGQGVAVTPLQMAAAFGAIANGGLLMRPFIVRRVLSPTGDVALENGPVVVRRVVSARTAATVTDLLRRAVEARGGTGEKAQLEGFPVAGKTGTAQKVDLRTGGYSSKRIGSFVGFVPADQPRVVILVLIDEPGTSSYGGVVAAPVFRAIAAGVLERLGVSPSSPPVQTVSVPRAAGRPREVAAHARAAAAGESAEAARGGTPSFIGLSMREALARAQATGWHVELSGVGYVSEQSPPPGAPLATERRLALRLLPSAAVASP